MEVIAPSLVERPVVLRPDMRVTPGDHLMSERNKAVSRKSWTAAALDVLEELCAPIDG